MTRSTTRRGMLAAIGSGTVAVASTTAVAQDDGTGDQWPDDCDDISDEDALSVDGTRYDGTLSPGARDALRLNLAEGSFAVVAARFEMYDQLRFRHGGDVSLTTSTGEPADEIEHVSTSSSYDNFNESGRYELRLYAETERPCIELYTTDGAPGSWAMAFERGGESPPPVEAPETIDERVGALEERVERLEERLGER